MCLQSSYALVVLLYVCVCVWKSNTFLAAGAVVPPGAVLKGGQLWAGNPAKALRALKVRHYLLVFSNLCCT
jgi:carbonic anhydrase/acetyltransferase-like protein (isoleucine patch superfamily)